MRYPLRAAIQYHWRNAQGALCRAKGWTRNVSEGGVLVGSTNCPTKGDLVQLTFHVPKSRRSPDEPAEAIRMSGEVVRVVIDAAGRAICGFALETRAKATRKAKKRANLVLQPSD